MQTCDVISFAKAVQVAGGRAFWVGGCVRDEFLNLEPKDFDIEVFGLSAEQLTAILAKFGNVKMVGESFSVFKMGPHLDISLPRRDTKTGRGHTGFSVESDGFMSFVEACRRRDFTMNAILKDVLTGEYIDPFQGELDIKNKLIRHVSTQTFGEDSLRVLRAAQFAARFEFNIDPGTIKLCKAVDLDDLPGERIWGELEKILLRANKPSIGLKYFKVLGVTEKLFPELKALEGVPQSEKWHPEGDVDLHTQMVVDEARKLIDDLPYEKKVTVMLAALAHDFGKPVSTEKVNGDWRSQNHDMAGLAPTTAFLDRIVMRTLENYNVRKQVLQLVRYHLWPAQWFRAGKVGSGAFRRLALEVDMDLLYRIAKADALGRWGKPGSGAKIPTAEGPEWFIAEAKKWQVEKKPLAPLILGRDLLALGLSPSPQFSELLKKVYELQMEGIIRTREEALSWVRNLLKTSP